MRPLQYGNDMQTVIHIPHIARMDAVHLQFVDILIVIIPEVVIACRECHGHQGYSK